jgi:hypothetical protein
MRIDLIANVRAFLRNMVVSSEAARLSALPMRE